VLYAVVLAALAAASGFMLGQWRFRWAGVAAGVALAFISTLVLRKLEFSAGNGIPVAAAVLAISQAAYLVGLMRRRQGPVGFLPDEQVDDVPDDGGDGDVSQEDKRHEEHPTHAAKMSQRRDTHPMDWSPANLTSHRKSHDRPAENR
jgi:hypothetical protein